MPKNISIIRINTSREKIWQALTEPAHVKSWQYGSDLITDWKPGNDIRFRTAWEDKVFEQWGKVLEVKPYDLIRYSLYAPRPGLDDIPENYFIMNYALADGDAYTELQITQEDNRPGSKQEEPQGEENPVLQALKKIAESLKQGRLSPGFVTCNTFAIYSFHDEIVHPQYGLQPLQDVSRKNPVGIRFTSTENRTW